MEQNSWFGGLLLLARLMRRAGKTIQVPLRNSKAKERKLQS
jgi:hypothetical protein